MKAFWKTRSEATRSGVTLGGIIAVCYVLGATIQLIGGSAFANAWGREGFTPIALVDALMLAVEIALLFAAGFKTTRANGGPLFLAAAEAGAIAGLFAGLAEAVTVMIVGISSLSARIAPFSGHPFFLYPLTNNFNGVTFAGIIAALIIHTSAGAVLGAAGGIFATPNPWREKDAA